MADSNTVKINSSGKWLRSDAAASYNRMLLAGMPTGGIAAAGRTYAQQQYLYNLYKSGRGNLAARPGTSAHETGRALDITRGTAAHTWATVGGVRLQTKGGESVRANFFGWYRTVTEEAWHFQYFPDRDKSLVLRKGSKSLYVKYIQKELLKTSHGAVIKANGGADGVFGTATEKAVKALQKAAKIKVDGKLGDGTRKALKAAVEAAKEAPVEPVPTPKPIPVPTPEPTPVPVPDPTPEPEPNNVNLRFGQVNLKAQRFGGLDDDSPERGELLSEKMGCSIYCLSEVPKEARNAIRKELGSAWKTYPVGYVAVMWDSAKWKHLGKKAITFDSRGVHGAIRAQLVSTRNGKELDVISVHIRPNDAIPGTVLAKAAGKQTDIKKALSLYRKGVPTIIAGDFNTSQVEKVKAAGFVQVHASTDTKNDRPGKQALDYVFVSKELVIRGHFQVSGKPVTDHDGWVAQLTLPESKS